MEILNKKQKKYAKKWHKKETCISMYKFEVIQE